MLSEKIFFSFYKSGDSSERFVVTRNEAVGGKSWIGKLKNIFINP
jgi:hypothetical protein